MCILSIEAFLIQSNMYAYFPYLIWIWDGAPELLIEVNASRYEVKNGEKKQILPLKRVSFGFFDHEIEANARAKCFTRNAAFFIALID